MSDVSAALEAKSDQLNAVDIMHAERVIRIRKVEVRAGEQPVSVFFDGDGDKPWKPCKGMLRVLAGAWGAESDNWIGKHAQLRYEPSVTYGGKMVGGVRIHSLSDIDPRGLSFTLALSKQKREPYPVPLLVVDETPYPAEKFDAAFGAMVDAMRDGMTLQQIIARCQQTGTLSPAQLARLEAEAPIDIEGDEGE